MATYRRGGVLIVTSAEALPSGRYRGFLTVAEEPGYTYKHCCSMYRDNLPEALADADADVEYAYRQYLVDHMSLPTQRKKH